MSDYGMVDALDKVRNIVHSLGWVDEGSAEQARDILSNFADASVALLAATAKAYPEICAEILGRSPEDIQNLIDRSQS